MISQQLAKFGFGENLSLDMLWAGRDAVCGDALSADRRSTGAMPLTEPGMRQGHGVEYARAAHATDGSRNDITTAAGTQRPKGVVGECPRSDPA